MLRDSLITPKENMRKYISSMLITLCIIAFLSSIGAAMAQAPDYKELIKGKYKNIDLSEGVSKEEAIIIAQNYLIGKGEDKIFYIKSGNYSKKL